MGETIQLLKEIWQYLLKTKKWWFIPLILLLIIIGLLIILTSTSPVPLFIYTLV